MTIRDEYLPKIGLPFSQAKIYALLLERGEMRLQEITDQSQIKRTTLYPIIAKMMDEGLVGIRIKVKTKYYFAQNPERLLEKAREQKNFIEALMPQLSALFNNQAKKSPVQFYDLPGAQKTVLKELNKLDPEKDELLVIEGDVESELRMGYEFWKNILKEKKRLNISSRTIVSDKEKGNFVLKDHKVKIRANTSLDNFKMSLFLLPRKVIITVPSQTLTLVIENQAIRDGLEDIFELTWRRSKEIN